MRLHRRAGDPLPARPVVPLLAACPVPGDCPRCSAVRYYAGRAIDLARTGDIEQSGIATRAAWAEVRE